MRSVLVAVIGAAAAGALAAPAGTGWTRVSVDAAGGAPDGDSQEPAVTPNGRFVAFYSSATDLLPMPGNSDFDVFVRDLRTGTTDLVSPGLSGGEGGGTSRYPSISNNGRWVVFDSAANDLVEGDAGLRDIFVADRAAGTVSLVSGGFDGSFADGDSSLYGASLSGNGRWAVFMSIATNLVEGADTHGYVQIYLRDIRAGTTTLVSRDRDDPLSGASGTCSDPSISPNGRFVVFSCNSANLVPGSSNGQMHVYIFDAKTKAMARVSVVDGTTLANNACLDPVVSNNGRFVAFYSPATNLVAMDGNGTYDAFLADRRTGEIRRLSDTPSSAGSYEPAISANGKVVVFYSEANDLVDGDGNATGDAFRYDVKTGTVTRLSVDAAGVEGNGYTYFYGPSLSSNGKWLAVTTAASNLAGPPGAPETRYDVYLRALK